MTAAIAAGTGIYGNLNVNSGGILVQPNTGSPVTINTGLGWIDAYYNNARVPMFLERHRRCEFQRLPLVPDDLLHQERHRGPVVPTTQQLRVAGMAFNGGLTTLNFLPWNPGPAQPYMGLNVNPAAN